MKRAYSHKNRTQHRTHWTSRRLLALPSPRYCFRLSSESPEAGPHPNRVASRMPQFLDNQLISPCRRKS